MTDSEGRRGFRFRVLVIFLMLVITTVITTSSVILVIDLHRPWTSGSIAQAVAAGFLTALSGLLIQSLPGALRIVLRQPEVANVGVLDLVGKLGRALRQPFTLAGLALSVVLIVTVGVAQRQPSSELESGRLVIMTAFSDSPNDPRSVLIEQWNHLHPENQVDIDYAGGETDQQHERMVNDARPGGPHRADIYVLDLVWMAEFVDRSYIRQLDESRLPDRDLADFLPKVLETCKRNDTLWALPFNTDAGLIFFRTDIAGVGQPKDWADYFGQAAVDNVKKAQAAGAKIEAANAAQLADEEVLTITTLEAIWANGGEVVSKNGQMLLTGDGSRVDFGPPARRAIEKLAASSTNPNIVLATGDEARTSTEVEAVSAFRNGRTLALRNWPVARDQIGDDVPFGVAATPTPSVLGGQNLAISAHTGKPRAAQALIEFLTSPSSQLILSEVGAFAPTRRSAFDNSKRPDTQAVLTALNEARLRPITPNYTEFSRAFRKGILRALNNNGQLEDGFAVELAEILRR